MSARRVVDHELVLRLWGDGFGSTEIAERLSLKEPATVRTIVRRARRAGDPRAVLRNPERSRAADDHIVLPPGLLARAKSEALRRAQPVPAFCLELLGTCLREGLVQAVLDDRPAEPPGVTAEEVRDDAS